MAEYNQRLHRGLWRLLYPTLGRWINRHYAISACHHQPEPKPPYLLLANHANLKDPWFIGANSRNAIAYMANREGFSGFRGVIGKALGAFPREKNQLDITALKAVMGLIRQGTSVGVFPEGDRCWDGETRGLQPGIVKLAKKLGCPLRLCRLAGSYQQQPRWADQQQPFPIKLDFITLSPAEVASLSTEQLLQRINQGLYVNAVAEGAAASAAGRNAAGIQRLLWLCPVCKAQDEISGQGCHVTCEACGTTAVLTAALKLRPSGFAFADIQQWFQWQQQVLRKQQADHPPLRSKRIVLLTESKPGRNGGKFADMIYADQMIRIDLGEGEHHTFIPQKIDSAADHFNRFFCISYAGKNYRFDFRNRNCSKWIQLLEILNQRFLK